VAVILEVAVLNVRPGTAVPFEAAFEQASPLVAAMPGYVSHQLQRCVEAPDRYLLLVQWATLEAHTVGFRGAPEYQRWKQLLHHFYDPFPTVEHYERVFPSGA
jgi:heme-degrading monooxygenase HmoA